MYGPDCGSSCHLGTPAQTVVSSTCGTIKGATVTRTGFAAVNSAGSFRGMFRWYFRWPVAGRGPANGPSTTSPVGIDRACEVGYIDLQRCPEMVFQMALSLGLPGVEALHHISPLGIDRACEICYIDLKMVFPTA